MKHNDNNNGQRPFKDLSKKELLEVLSEAGVPRFRCGQLLEWVYKNGARSYEEMTSIPKAMREQLKDAFPLYYPTVKERLISKDQSRKYLLQLNNGHWVETVAMPSNDGRLSVCVSSQAGCAMGCAFCATGKQGLGRNLAPGEIVDQVSVVQEDFQEEGLRVSNVVVMGQGEPFANLDATLAALELLNDPRLFNIGARHITVSTCGIIAGIEALANTDAQYTLAVSLHSAIQETRNLLMPAMKEQPLKALGDALVAYTTQTHRRVSLEYALLAGVNDGEEDIEALVSFCRGLLCHVNLIPFNSIDESAFRPSSPENLRSWQKRLEEAGVSATTRNSRGADIAGACGQLAARSLA